MQHSLLSCVSYEREEAMPSKSTTAAKMITLEPHWPGMRRYAVAMYLSGDHANANSLVKAMGYEAPREWPPTADTDPEAGQRS